MISQIVEVAGKQVENVRCVCLHLDMHHQLQLCQDQLLWTLAWHQSGYSTVVIGYF